MNPVRCVPARWPPRGSGACEFAFYIHDDCRPAMAAVAATIEEMCAWSATQPDGLVYLGSWESAHDETLERTL